MTKKRLTRRQRQVRRNRIILACAAAALLIIIIVIISVSMKGCSKSKKTDKNGESTTAKVEESTQTKENESSSEEPASTNADNSSVTTANATSVSASSDSSVFVPPVVPSGIQFPKVLLLKDSRFRKLMEQLILTEYLLPIRHMLFLRISFPLILTSLLMQTEAQHVLTRLL